MQLFNIGWKGESGIGRYTEEFKNDYWFIQFSQTGVIKDGNSIKVVGKLSNAYLLYHIREVSTNAFKVKITGIKDKIRYSYILSGKENNVYFSVDGIYDIPASESIEENKTSCGFYINDASVALDWIGLTIEIIPSNKGALCLDGINDFGKVINMPIYKDYTFIIDREILSIDNIGIIASKSESAEDATKHGAFIFEYLTAPNGINTIKFENNAKWFGFTFYREDGSIIGDCDITIKQIGEYEGAYCLDGVDDFVTIPTLSKREITK